MTFALHLPTAQQGAAFTFDAQDYVNFVKALKQTPAPKDGVPYRTFSHSKKDPELAPIPIQPHNRIIVIEGLYTLLNISPWKEATDLLDERVWIDCKPDIARERLVARHVRTGVEATVEAARARGESLSFAAEKHRYHLAFEGGTAGHVLTRLCPLAPGL